MQLLEIPFYFSPILPGEILTLSATKLMEDCEHTSTQLQSLHCQMARLYLTTCN